MSEQEHPYVELRAGMRYLCDSCVPLESLIWLWRDDQSAEAIRETYPTLRLAEVYGALAYYLDHQTEVDHDLAEGLAQFETPKSPLSL